MNKKELISAIAKKENIKVADVECVVNAAFDAIKNAVAEGDTVTLVGFGTFEAREHAERTCPNPQKPGEKITVPACKAPAFKAGKAFKDIVK